MEALWKLIFDVCRVTGGDPVNEWQAHMERLSTLRDKMNALDLESVHFESSNGTDLTVGLADQAVWESAASKSEKGVVFLPNIPTEEVFTAPHKDRVEGVVYGTKPYVFNGQLIKDFRVTFEKGRVVDYHAEQGQVLLGRLLDGDEGSRSIGEVALVPASSPINRSGKLFYSTLFDENAACHIAFGASYPGTTKDGTALTKEELLARGMNQSRLHEGCDDRCRGQPYHRQMPRWPHRGAVPGRRVGAVKDPAAKKICENACIIAGCMVYSSSTI